MVANYILACALGLGFVAGLRALLAPAAIAWAVHLGWLNLQGSLFGFMESKVALVAFSFLALSELIGDKLPRTPKRTGLAPLLARVLTGGLSASCLLVSAKQSLAVGAILGAIGAVLGAFAGYEIRKRSVIQFNAPDFFVALLEDGIAISLALFLVSR